MTKLTVGGIVVAAFLAVIGGFPFDMEMPTHAFGWVGPTCGLTRGSTAIARGDLARAMAYNSASLLVMAFGAYGALRALVGYTTGRWLTVRLRPSRWGWLVLVAAVAMLWANQQANAEFVMNARGWLGTRRRPGRAQPAGRLPEHGR